MSAYLDTHVAVWLHDGLTERLSVEAKRQIEAQELLLSPMALVELQYLHNKKRIRLHPEKLYSYLHATVGVRLCDYPFPAVVLSALGLNWSADPFDRLIVAQAKANNNSPLITADSNIRAHYPPAVW